MEIKPWWNMYSCSLVRVVVQYIVIIIVTSPAGLACGRCTVVCNVGKCRESMILIANDIDAGSAGSRPILTFLNSAYRLPCGVDLVFSDGVPDCRSGCIL